MCLKYFFYIADIPILIAFFCEEAIFVVLVAMLNFILFFWAKEDEQQRNWMLHEDELLILRNMEKLCHTLKNANEEIRQD